MGIKEEDKQRIKEQYFLFVAQNKSIEVINEEIQDLKERLEKKVQKLKELRKKDVELIDEINQKYNIELTPDIILKIINE